MIDKSEIQKQEILKLLSNEDVAVLSLAYMYAENFHKYGFDVTEKCLTATEQTACMNRAYIRGRQDEAERYGNLSRIEKELHGLTPKQQYNFLDSLMHKKSVGWNSSALYVTAWLAGEED